MGKKHEFGRRKKVALTPKQAAARKAGIVTTISRESALQRLLETAASLWFVKADSLVIHLLVIASYKNLEVLGKERGKAPSVGEHAKGLDFMLGYDFIRHATSDPQELLDFPEAINDLTLFSCIDSFGLIYGRRTPIMRTCQAYFALTATPDDHQPCEPTEFFPVGFNYSLCRALGRMEFFERMLPVFSR